MTGPGRKGKRFIADPGGYTKAKVNATVDGAKKMLSSNEGVGEVFGYTAQAVVTKKVGGNSLSPKSARGNFSKTKTKVDAEVAPNRIPDPDGGFTADLSKSKAKSRSGHSNAGNKQLHEEMRDNPAKRAEHERRLGYDAFDRTSTSNGGRRNPRNHEWDHNTKKKNALDLRSKDNHAQKTRAEGQQGGGFKRNWKEE